MTDKEKAKELALTLLGEDQNPEPIVEILMEMAQWKEKQMMKDAVVGHVSTMYNGMLRATTRLMDKNIQEKLGIKFGDTVKLIIVKENWI